MSAHHGVVVRTEPLGSSLIRVVLAGDGLADVDPPDATDAYVNLALPPPGAPYGGAFDPVAIREAHPAHPPARRRYTVRRWDLARRELWIDFVVHGDRGVAGPWARAAQPGDVLVFQGPSGGYRPDPAAAHHLMVGDEAALPAIAASLESLPDTARVTAVLVCDGPDAEIDLPTAAAAHVVWLHRAGGPSDADLLPAAVADLDLPDVGVQAFVHGEAEEVRAVRRHLLVDRGVARADLSASPYWRRDMTDEAWRAVKADWTAEVEREA